MDFKTSYENLLEEYTKLKQELKVEKYINSVFMKRLKDLGQLDENNLLIDNETYLEDIYKQFIIVNSELT